MSLDDVLASEADNRYDTFIKAIDRVLRQFERSSEWTYLISILTAVQQVRARLAIIPDSVSLEMNLITFCFERHS